MSFVLINHAPDGTHMRVFETDGAAKDVLSTMLGGDQGVPLVIGRTYYSDWGNALTIEERPPGWSADAEEARRHAYDARECGTLTDAQEALLETHRW